MNQTRINQLEQLIINHDCNWMCEICDNWLIEIIDLKDADDPAEKKLKEIEKYGIFPF